MVNRDETDYEKKVRNNPLGERGVVGPTVEEQQEAVNMFVAYASVAILALLAIGILLF